MKRIIFLFFALSLLITFYSCSDPCRDAADKVKNCLEKFCSKYQNSSDQARMKCNTFYTVCPNGENAACGFDYDKCSRNNALADEILDGKCDETTGEIIKK